MRQTGCYTAALLTLVCLCLPQTTSAQKAQADATRPPCSDCHVCAEPSKTEPCLKVCMRAGVHTGGGHSPTEGPDIAVLGELEAMYQAVRFNHKLHAEMVGMGAGCGTCHHYSPTGKFPPCNECHPARPSEPQNLRQPGLKGAYHRQCMGCHREWSHDTRCVVCHLPLNGLESASPVDSTDILGIAHPIITEPDLRVYHTPHEPGPIVTFHHKEHIELFGLRCTDCHQRENCGFCHDLQKPATLAKSMEEVHAICNDCHRSDRCDKCHDVREKPAFTHAVTGWPLSRFHKALDCRACHPTGRRIGRLNAACEGCHGGWDPENFDHAVTGLVLDEDHREFDCGDCHSDRQFGVMPSCSGCHDDDRSPTTQPPGARLPWPSD